MHRYGDETSRQIFGQRICDQMVRIGIIKRDVDKKLEGRYTLKVSISLKHSWLEKQHKKEATSIYMLSQEPEKKPAELAELDVHFGKQ